VPHLLKVAIAINTPTKNIIDIALAPTSLNPKRLSSTTISDSPLARLINHPDKVTKNATAKTTPTNTGVSIFHTSIIDYFVGKLAYVKI
jgi:hypothetical protein